MSGNRNRIIVNLRGDWTEYQSQLHSCYKMLGTVSRGSDKPGTLAVRKDNGLYVQLNNSVETELLQRKVIAAISQQVEG